MNTIKTNKAKTNKTSINFKPEYIKYLSLAETFTNNFGQSLRLWTIWNVNPKTNQERPFDILCQYLETGNESFVIATPTLEATESCFNSYKERLMFIKINK